MNKDATGIIIDHLLSNKQAPPNNAMAVTGEKLGINSNNRKTTPKSIKIIASNVCLLFAFIYLEICMTKIEKSMKISEIIYTSGNDAKQVLKLPDFLSSKYFLIVNVEEENTWLACGILYTTNG